MSTILVIPSDGEQLDHLRHALDTWAKYGPPIDHVIVVGNVAGLRSVRMDEQVTFWPIPQLQNQPRLNNQRNLASVIEKDWPSDVTFIFSHDDIFLTKPADLKRLTKLTKYGLKKQPPVQTRSRVAAATRVTLEMLSAQGRPAVNYELHLPLVIPPEDRSFWVELMPRNDGMQFRSWVLNHLQARPLRLIDDVKIFRDLEKLPALGIYSTAKNLNPRPIGD